ncbi:MAG: hypothetical protein ABII27_03265 [bacterium]
MQKINLKLAVLTLIFSFMFLRQITCNDEIEKIEYYKTGPYAVQTEEFTDLIDPDRDNRNVPLKVFFPEEGENYPLVIMSHGAMGNLESMIYQAEHLASHGYVVICTEHVFSNSKIMKYYRSRAGGRKSLKQIIQIMLRDTRERLQRPRDISFAIDKAEIWNKSNKTLKNKINANKIAVMGHSYGAYTTLLICGAQTILDTLNPSVDPGKGLAGDYSDVRVKFGLALSPQGPGLLFNEDSYKTIDRPLVCLSGTKDLQESVASGKPLPAETRLKPFLLAPPKNKYCLWLENADHLSFAQNKATVFLPSRVRKDVQRITKAMMVISCDHFLKGKKEASEKLNKEYFNSLCGRVVAKIKWYEK